VDVEGMIGVKKKNSFNKRNCVFKFNLKDKEGA
jgi:hypothetical protein